MTELKALETPMNTVLCGNNQVPFYNCPDDYCWRNAKIVLEYLKKKVIGLAMIYS